METCCIDEKTSVIYSRLDGLKKSDEDSKKRLHAVEKDVDALKTGKRRRFNNIVSQEETNFIRIYHLLLRVAPPAVRVKFDTEFNPDILQNTLDRKRNGILGTLKKNRIINQAQWDKLFPPGGKAKSTSFDLSLMICLIRSLTSIQVSDKLPFPADESDGAHLSRLKIFRNDITHSKDGILSATAFEEYWTCITNAIVKFGGNLFRQRCSDLKMSTLDESYKEILVEIRNTIISNDPIPRGVRRINGDVIESWEKEKIVVTRAIRRIEYLIKRDDIVTAVGSSGCGKSTAIHFVALQLHRQDGYDIVPVYTPEEVRQYYDPEYKQVFVIDDICGKSTKDTSLVNSWERLSKDVEMILKSRTVKILSSCRKGLCKDLFKNLTLLSNSICDLSLDFCLTNRERIEIASIFLTEAEVKIIAESNIYGTFDYFPLLCRMYFARKPVQILDFFNNPLEFIKDDFKLLLYTKNSKTIATLMLFVVYNNNLNTNVLSEIVVEKQILKDIADSFCLETPFSSEDVRYELNRLNHSYVKRYGNSYSMCHDKVFDIFLSFLCEHKLILVLELAHTYVIRDRFLFESLRENETDQYLIDNSNIIPEMNEEVYFSRLLRDITHGFIANVLWNKQNKHCKFRQRLIHLITGRVSNQEILQKLSADEFYELLASTISQGYSEFVPLLLLDHVDINHCIPFMGTPLYIAIEKGYVDIVRLLLNKEADPKIKYGNETPLFLAVEKGNFDIINLLLRNKADPNIANSEGTPLYRAVEHGYANIVELLLHNEANPNTKHTIGIPDFVASQDGKIREVPKIDYKNEKFIISCGTSLHKAVEKDNLAIVKLLLDHNADPNIIAYRGTPLYIAAEHGNIDIVKILLHFEAKPDLVSNLLFKATPLFRAAEKGYINIVQILLDHNADPLIEFNGKTPLAIAKYNHYRNIAHLIHRHKSATHDLPMKAIPCKYHA